jgi:hypothetical protein
MGRRGFRGRGVWMGRREEGKRKKKRRGGLGRGLSWLDRFCFFSFFFLSLSNPFQTKILKLNFFSNFFQLFKLLKFKLLFKTFQDSNYFPKLSSQFKNF